MAQIIHQNTYFEWVEIKTAKDMRKEALKRSLIAWDAKGRSDQWFDKFTKQGRLALSSDWHRSQSGQSSAPPGPTLRAHEAHAAAHSHWTRMVHFTSSPGIRICFLVRNNLGGVGVG